ncbi:TPA: winged helix DNA-binding protein [Staphylococcus aureus]|nr:winged helix DNA-binding protein [Staphylococcus aureus]
MYVENSYLSKQLCFLFYVSSKEIIKKYTNYLKDYDLTYTGYIVLMAIENDEKLNIKKLEKKDYVVRTREEKDERNLQISLTEQGKAIKSPLAEISVKVFNEFNISEREASDIVNNLRNFVSKNFDNSDKK